MQAAYQRDNTYVWDRSRGGALQVLPGVVIHPFDAVTYASGCDMERG